MYILPNVSVSRVCIHASQDVTLSSLNQGKPDLQRHTLVVKNLSKRDIAGLSLKLDHMYLPFCRGISRKPVGGDKPIENPHTPGCWSSVHFSQDHMVTLKSLTITQMSPPRLAKSVNSLQRSLFSFWYLAHTHQLTKRRSHQIN